MDRNKICEAMYALPGGVVVKRRKSQLRAAVLFIAGVALVVVNNMYGAELTNNMRSAIVFIGGLLILLPMTTSRAVWVIVGLLVIVVGVLMAIDRLKPGKLLGDGGNIIDAQ